MYGSASARIWALTAALKASIGIVEWRDAEARPEGRSRARR
jgi:hypothetical protein